MTTELMYLALVTTLTAVMWIPYILNLILVRGLMDAVGYPDRSQAVGGMGPTHESRTLQRGGEPGGFRRPGAGRERRRGEQRCTAAAAAVYFWARIAHFFAYTFRIAWVRTLAFAIGWLAQMAIAWHILA